MATGAIDQNEVFMEFKKAVEYFNGNRRKYSDKQTMKLDACLKQVQIGDINIPPPKSFLAGKARQSWKAWNDLSGTPLLEAMQMYIELLKALDPGYPPKL